MTALLDVNVLVALFDPDHVAHARARSGPEHAFWPCDTTITDASVFDLTRITGHKQVTDVYLLALAVGRGGRFVTFDRRVPISAVAGATDEHLVVL